MKKYFAFIVFFFFSITLLAQNSDINLPAYKRFPTLPPIQILLSDSTTTFTKSDIPKNKPVVFMIFSPECSHCQHETDEIKAHMDELKDVEIVMITYHPLSRMKQFIADYGLDAYPNIVVGKDVNYITMGFYDMRNLPYMAMYNKKGQLIEGMEGSVPIPRVIEMLNSK